MSLDSCVLFCGHSAGYTSVLHISEACANGQLKCHLHPDVIPSPLSYKWLILPATSLSLTIIIIANIDYIIATSEAGKWLSLVWNHGNMFPEAAFQNYAVFAKRGLGSALEIIS